MHSPRHAYLTPGEVGICGAEALCCLCMHSAGPVSWEHAAWLFCTCASWLCFPGPVPQHACRESGASGNCWASQACAGGLVVGGGQALLAGFDGNLRQTKYSWNTMVEREWGMVPSWTSADSLTVLDLSACCCLIRSWGQFFTVLPHFPL